MSSSHLTNIFFRGVGIPPSSNGMFHHKPSSYGGTSIWENRRLDLQDEFVARLRGGVTPNDSEVGAKFTFSEIYVMTYIMVIIM